MKNSSFSILFFSVLYRSKIEQIDDIGWPEILAVVLNPNEIRRILNFLYICLLFVHSMHGDILHLRKDDLILVLFILLSFENTKIYIYQCRKLCSRILKFMVLYIISTDENKD